MARTLADIHMETAERNNRSIDNFFATRENNRRYANEQSRQEKLSMEEARRYELEQQQLQADRAENQRRFGLQQQQENYRTALDEARFREQQRVTDYTLTKGKEEELRQNETMYKNGVQKIKDKAYNIEQLKAKDPAAYQQENEKIKREFVGAVASGAPLKFFTETPEGASRLSAMSPEDQEAFLQFIDPKPESLANFYKLDETQQQELMSEVLLGEEFGNDLAAEAARLNAAKDAKAIQQAKTEGELTAMGAVPTQAIKLPPGTKINQLATPETFSSDLGANLTKLGKDNKLSKVVAEKKTNFGNDFGDLVNKLEIAKTDPETLGKVVMVNDAWKNSGYDAESYESLLMGLSERFSNEQGPHVEILDGMLNQYIREKQDWKTAQSVIGAATKTIGKQLSAVPVKKITEPKSSY